MLTTSEQKKGPAYRLSWAFFGEIGFLAGSFDLELDTAIDSSRPLVVLVN